MLASYLQERDMRGADDQTDHMFSYLSPETRVRPDHPLRTIRRITDGALQTISPELERLYADIGRPSIPPEQLLRALVIQVLYSVRSERLLMEEIDYSVLFRWFIGLNLDTPIWSHSTFSKNRERLLRGDIAGVFFAAVVAQAREAGLLSDEHFTVDGTQLEAWASLKSFQPRDAPPPDDPDRGNPTVDFHGQRRRNDTHVSRTDPDARLYRKADGEKAVLAYLAHVLLDNRHGLVHSTCVTAADGVAEREAAQLLLEARGRRRGTVGADKAYNTTGFVTAARALAVTPHVATKARYNAIDGRVTRTPGYAVSQRKRKLVEQVFGWMKTVGLLRKLRHRGGERVTWIVTFTAATYNMVRMRRLLVGT
jgi:transposase